LRWEGQSRSGLCGRGIIVAIDFLRKVSQAMDDVDLVLYDVPVTSSARIYRTYPKGLVSQVYIITSGEYMPSMLLTTSAKACGA